MKALVHLRPDGRWLPFTEIDDWRWRWLVLGGWRRLHRVANFFERDEEWRVGVEGKTVCGLRAWLSMPGFVSRMYLERCAHCCRGLGLARGEGAPYNGGINA